MARQEFEETLGRVLAGEVDVEALLERRSRARTFRPKMPMRKPARVLISNTESDFYSVVDVVADDRIGLLHDLTKCIGDHSLEIFVSKAATIQDQVTDTFYLKDASGRKIRDPNELERLEGDLLQAASGGSEAESAASIEGLGK